MPRQSKDTLAILGIDIGKNTFHLVGLNKRGAIVLRQKLSRRLLESRLANLPPRLIGMEACVVPACSTSTTTSSATGGAWMSASTPSRWRSNC